MNALWEQVLQSPSLLLVTLTAAGVSLLWVLRRRLRRAAEAAGYANPEATDGLDLQVADYGTGGRRPVQVMDWRSSDRRDGLRRSFTEAMDWIDRTSEGKDGRYQRPWVLSLGQVAGGKTTLFEQARIQLPYGRPEERGSPPCNWWFFDRSLVLDVSGDLVLRTTDASSDQPTWLELLKLMRHHRPRRPLDAILLTIPVRELVGSGPRERRLQRAKVLRRKLEQVQERLSMQVPVFLVISQCDHLEGFAEVVASLEPAQRAEIFGWSRAGLPEDQTFSGTWVDTAIDSMVQSLERLQLETLKQGEDSTKGPRWVAFPAVIDSLREELRVVLGQIFAPVPGSSPPALRGLYLTGGDGFDELEEGPHQLIGEDPTLASAIPESAHRRVDFLTDLLCHKIFYEWSLGRPDPVRLTRRQRWKRWMQVALVTLIAVAPWALWRNHRQAAHRASQLETLFLRPAQEALTGEGGPSAEQGEALLSALHQVPDYRLRSIFMPVSWWSGFGDHMTAVTAETLNRVLFPQILGRLERDLGRLPGPMDDSGPTPPIRDVETVPEFSNLEQSLERLDRLERHLDQYNCFAPPQCTLRESVLLRDFVALVSSVHYRDIRPPTTAAQAFLGDALERAQPTRRKLGDDGLKDRFRARSRQMYHRLYSGNVLTEDLSQLSSQIQSLGWIAHGESEAALAYRELSATLKTTQEDLMRPELVWAGSEDFALGAAYEEVLRSMINSGFLGLDFAKVVKKEGIEGASGFEGFRQSLADARTDLTGDLLAREDAVVQLQLSSKVLGLQAVLEALLAQRFMRLQPTTELQLEPPEGTFLRWLGPEIDQAVALYEAYNSFLGQSFEGFEGLRRAIEEGVREQLERNIMALLADAQTFPQHPVVFTRQQGEGHVRAQVTNLQEVSESLNRLFEVLQRPVSGSRCAHSVEGAVHCQLTATLTNQRTSLLEELDRLLEEARLYQPNEEAFIGWSGDTNLSWEAFEVDDGPGLEEYLKQQWSTAQVLGAELAEPTLVLVPIQDYWDIEDGEAFRRWRLFISDLAQFDAKEPQNPLAELEQFVTQELASIRTGDCLEVEELQLCFGVSTPRSLTAFDKPCDLFVEAQKRLRQDTVKACRGAVWQAGASAYGTLQESFESTLADKYPFVERAVGGVEGNVTADDLGSFFEVFDDQRPAIERLFGDKASWPHLSESERLALEQVKARMGELGAVRTFFDDFLADYAQNSSALPVFDVDVEFRVNRDFETRGDEIIRWRFDIGEELMFLEPQMFLGEPPSEGKKQLGRWTCGQPLKLTLDWAQDSPTVPWADDEDANVRAEDRALVFEYRDPWALLSLLRDRRTSLDDLPNRRDGRPQTLSLEASILELPPSEMGRDRGGARPRKEASGFEPEGRLRLPSAKVFVRLMLRKPDETGAELPVPVFPWRLPSLPQPDIPMGRSQPSPRTVTAL